MEREILFCITALQMGLTTAEQLKEIGKDLSEKKIVSIRSELIKRASISPEKIKTVEHAVDISASLYNGNFKKILSLGIYRKLVREAFGDSISISRNGELRPSYPKIRLDENAEDIHTVTEEAPERYLTLRDIGAGGIGKVILAFDKHTGRNIAIKELISPPANREFGDSVITPDEARFLREARLTAQLEHPSVVPVYEIGRKSNNAIYYTMKYVKGRTLSEIIRSCSSLNERLRFLSHFVNLCNAIAYAHSKGVIHRDIKPHNVMIGEFGETVVLDWGLAKIKGLGERENEKFANQMKLLQDAAAGKTIAGEVMGTPQYMPPEQAWGDVSNIDEKSDIYSLGAVLYEILTGFPPFEGDSPIDIVKEVRAYSRGEVKLKTVKEEEPECPDELAAIAEKSLSADKQRRYASVTDLIDDVEAYIAGHKVRGHRYSFFSYLRYVFRKGRKSFIFIFSILAITALSVYSIHYFDNLRKGTQLRLYKERIFRNLENNDLVSASYYSLLAESLKSDTENLSGISQNTFASSLLNAAILKEKKISSASISKDNRFLAAGTESGTVILFEPKTLKILGRMSFDSGVEKVVFSSESDRLAAGFSDGSVRIFNLSPFSMIKMLKDFSTPVRAITFSEGGRYFFAAAGQIYTEQKQCTECSIRIYSTEIYKYLDKLSGHTKSVTNIVFSDTDRHLISSSLDGNIIFWDIFGKKETARINLNAPITDFSIKKNRPGFALTEDGRIILFRPDADFITLTSKSFSHSIITSSENLILTGGGAYSEGRCIFCDIRIYDGKNGLFIFQGFPDRISSLSLSEDRSILAVSDDKGRIMIFDFANLRKVPSEISYIHLSSGGIADLRCPRNANGCYLLDNSLKLTELLPDNPGREWLFSSNLSNKKGSYFITSAETLLLNPQEGGIFYIKYGNSSDELIINEPIRIQSISMDPREEYIGITDTEDTFYLLKKSGNRIIDSSVREKNILSFSFLPDAQFLYLLRSDMNAANEKIFIISEKELMTDNPEKVIIRTRDELRELIPSESPLVMGEKNNIFVYNKNGTVTRLRIDLPFQMKKIIHIPRSCYSLILFEEKNFIAVYDISARKISYYLTGHTSPVRFAAVKDERIYTADSYGVVIVYKTGSDKTSRKKQNSSEAESARLRAIMENLGIFYD
ncbi:MAG: WD40 repeat domain-containing serine/threonine-protein kinase [Deltaproteobacteria bacterium]|nr:WD40 repeat domain-containing serine/threonine-protein kinase [Deltaproteobacteria bacterium]